MKLKRKQRLAFFVICAMVLLCGGMIVNASSKVSSLMSIEDKAKFYEIPILSDYIEATTYYGRDTYSKTAQCSVNVKAYKKNGTYTSSGTINRSGWDAVSGEGGKGPCTAKVSMRSCKKGVCFHKGRATSSSRWESYTWTAKNPYI